MIKVMLLAAALAASALHAQPQKIYRCGPEGRQLQQHPCNDGQAPLAGPPAAPSAAERAEAAARAKRESQWADRMQREREQLERAQARDAAPAVGIGATAASAPKPARKTSPAKKKSEKSAGTQRDGDFAAVSPRQPAKKKP